MLTTPPCASLHRRQPEARDGRCEGQGIIYNSLFPGLGYGPQRRMSLTLSIDELLRYSAQERDTWRRWLRANPAAIEAPVQPGGRFATVGKLIDHIFLVERRHLQRLRQQPLANATGLTGNNAPPLFDYGASVRREMEQFIRSLEDHEIDEIRTIDVRDQQWPISPRKLLFHILLHEIRHWAQIALAVRLGGFEPPGDHDLFFSHALK